MEATATVESRSVGYKLMGGLAMAGGVFYLAGTLIAMATGNWESVPLYFLSLLWTLGCIAGLVGIGMLGALGRGIFGRVALTIAMIVYAVAAVDALLIMAGVYSGEASPLFSVSRLGSLAAMLLVGIAALAARRWPGWRKFSPFALPLAIPVAIAAGAVSGSTQIPITLFVSLAWLLIGYAVWSSPEID